MSSLWASLKLLYSCSFLFLNFPLCRPAEVEHFLLARQASEHENPLARWNTSLRPFPRIYFVYLFWFRKSVGFAEGKIKDSPDGLEVLGLDLRIGFSICLRWPGKGILVALLYTLTHSKHRKITCRNCVITAFSPWTLIITASVYTLCHQLHTGVMCHLMQKAPIELMVWLVSESALAVVSCLMINSWAEPS